MTPFVVIMGVSGCGKTTIAKLLAEETSGAFLEGDSFHPPANKEKMAAGIPLQDEDRLPWFDLLIEAADAEIRQGRMPVLSCSALKQSYRDYLFEKFAHPRLVFLRGDFETIKERMDSRSHEYMSSALLQSQFETLEEPQSGEHVLVLSIQESPQVIVAEVVRWLERGESN